MLKSIIKNSEKLMSHSRVLASFYHRAYARVIKRELAMLKLQDGAKVLFVGAGAFPFTPLWLATYEGCRVLALDIDDNAVKRAKKVIKKYSLNAFIDVQTGSVDTLNTSFDAAIIAMQVSPLNATVETLRKAGVHSLIIRRANTRYQAQYDALSKDYTIAKTTTHNMRAFHDSVLLTF